MLAGIFFKMSFISCARKQYVFFRSLIDSVQLSFMADGVTQAEIVRAFGDSP